MTPWYYNVPDWAFTIINAGLAAWATLLTTKGSFYDLRYTKQWWKFITTRGLTFFGITLLIVGFLIWQKKEEDFQKGRNERVLAREQQKRDSIISQKVDSNSNKLYDKIAKAFETRDLKIDTLNGIITSLKDTLKGQKAIPVEDPSIIIREDGISVQEVNEQKLKFFIELTCTNASAKNLQLDNFGVIVYQDGTLQTLSRDNLVDTKSIIAKNDQIVASFSIEGLVTNINHLDMAIVGTYQNSINGKTIRMRDVYVYDFETKKTRVMLNQYAESFFKRYKLKV